MRFTQGYWLSCLATFALGFESAGAQAPTTGPVRITAPNLRLLGKRFELTAIRGDTMFVIGRDSVLRSVPIGRVTRLEQLDGRTHPVGGTAGLGLVGGLLLGVGAGAAACESGWLFDAGTCVALAGGGGALVGLVAGAVVGLVITTERWRPMVLTAGSGTIGVRLSLGSRKPPAGVIWEGGGGSSAARPR